VLMLWTKSTFRINTNMGLHAKVPLMALFCRTHLRVTRVVFILCGRGRSYQGRVCDGPRFIFSFFSSRSVLISSNRLSVTWCFSKRWRKLRRVFHPGWHLKCRRGHLPSRDQSVRTPAVDNRSGSPIPTLWAGVQHLISESEASSGPFIAAGERADSFLTKTSLDGLSSFLMPDLNPKNSSAPSSASPSKDLDNIP